MATAFLSSTYIFSDTIQNTFDNLFADAFRNTDAYVRSSNVIEADFGNKQRDRLPDSVIAEVKAVPGVADAQGDVMGFASIIGKDGKPLVSGQTAPPTFGGGRRSPATWPRGRFVEGPAPSGPDQVAIDKGSANKGHFAVGDTDHRSPAPRALREFTLVGHRPLRRRRLPRRRHVRALRPADGAGVRRPSPASSTPCRSRATGRSATRSWPAGSQSTLGQASETEVLTGAEITKENQSDIQDEPPVLHRLPERRGLHRPVRLVLRHLQRLLDHGGAAQAGERADAGDRRQPPSGRRVAAARVRRRGRWSAPSSGSASACCWPWG